MLSPESRTVAMEVLRPPPGHRLDLAVLTTYSLDLDVLLALPLAVMAQSDRGVDELLEDPLLLLEALREAGERVHVFVDQGGIAIPGTSRALFAMLEESVHPVRAPNGGAFHPKVWMARFLDDDGAPVIRVAVSSRNLTFDRSWDVALSSEASPRGRRAVPESRALGDLLQALPGMAVRKLRAEPLERLEQLATEVKRTAFPAPERFESPIRFQALGLKPGIGKPWHPAPAGTNLLAVAPFVNATALKSLTAVSDSERTLISRREALDDLSEEALAEWDPVWVLSDAAVDEPEDGKAERPSGLHAKLIALEHGRQVSWYVGSANLTAAAFTGSNVEVMAAITGPRGNAGSGKGFGIERFQSAGFLNLCEPYHRSERLPVDPTLKQAADQLEKARDALLASNLKVVCSADGEHWRWELQGDLQLPEPVTITAWPVSIDESQGRTLDLPAAWPLPLSRLTAFVAFRLHVDADVDDIRLALKLPAQGMPEGRIAQVLRTLINSPERFLQFLRALLGGFETLADWGAEGNGGNGKGGGFATETLLEDLVRIASRDPARLEPVRRLIEDLRASPDGEHLVPNDLYELWQVIDAVIADAGTRRGAAR
jgi:hypothetical protein